MIAFINGRILPISQAPIASGTVLVQGSKIKAVGKSPSIPKSAEIIDVKGMTVMPGMIDAHCHLGIGGEGMGPRFGDGNESEPVSPHLRALDAIWNDDPSFGEVLAAGVTTVWVCPGSVNIFGGTGVAIKTCPGTIDARALPGTEGMKMAFGENPKRVHHTVERYPTTRMGIAALARETLFNAREYGRSGGKSRKKDFRLEALQPLLKRKMKARIHAHRADDILTAIRIAEEFKFDLVIEHCTEGFKVKEILAEKKIPAVVGPHLSGRSKPETAVRTLANVVKLHKAGIKVALQTDAGSAAQFLSVHAGLAVREGLPREAALRAITLDAAFMFGASRRIGSLAPGRDADIVVLPGDPLDVTVKPAMVYVDGVRYV